MNREITLVNAVATGFGEIIHTLVNGREVAVRACS